jgi:diguanylate cyclase (GGDEF)-like protein
MNETIRTFEIFADLNDAEMSIIEKLFVIKLFDKNDVILKKGESNKTLFIVIEGRIASTENIARNRNRKPGEFLAGDFFGEVSFSGSKPVFDSYIASEKSRLLALSETKLLKLIEQHSDLAVKFISRLLGLTIQQFRNSSTFFSDIVRWGENASRRVITDELTGIYNRAFLEDAVENFFNISQSNNKSLSLFMIDLDNFRVINETYGLDAGNQILLVLVSVIKSVISSHGIIARYGGDEFSVLLPEANIEQAVRIAETICREVEAYDFSKYMRGEKIPVTTSIGISSFPETADNIVMFKEKADASLYKAKESGRNRVAYVE